MKIETKFNRGETLYTVSNDRIEKFTPDKITIHLDSDGIQVIYRDGAECVEEDKLFRTKEELVDFLLKE